MHVGERWLREHRLVLALGLLASIPVLTSTIRALVAGWTPVNDSAIVALRSFDVFTTHTPLLGDYSNTSLVAGYPVYSPGPLLFWLLAIPTHLFGDWALALTVGLLNTACVMGVVALARRRGGDVFMFATAAAIPLMCLSVPEETLHDIVNPASALLPFALLLFLAWSVACGEYRLVPLTALVISFVAQSHLSLAWPTVVTTFVALGGLWWRLRRRRTGSATRAAAAPWLFAGLAVAILCWLPPLLDQAVHQPGNLARIAQAATGGQKTLTLAQGWHALVGAIGIWPWWLTPSPTAFGQQGAGWAMHTRVENVATAPFFLSALSCVVILGALALVAVRGRRVRSDLRVGAALGVVLSLTIVIVTASTPAKLGYDLLKGLLWAAPAGMFVWLVLGWAVTAAAGNYLARRWQPRGDVSLRASLAGLAAVAVITGVVAGNLPGSDSNARWYQPVRTIVSRVVAWLPHTGVTIVNGRGDYNTFTVQAALIYELRKRGYRVVTLNGYLALDPKLGEYYDACRDLPDRELLIADDGQPLSPGALSLAHVPVPTPTPGPSERILRVSVVPAAATSFLTTCAQSPRAAVAGESARGRTTAPRWA